MLFVGLSGKSPEIPENRQDRTGQRGENKL